MGIPLGGSGGVLLGGGNIPSGSLSSGGGAIAASAASYPDEVIVYPGSDALDTDNAPTIGDGAGVTLACSVEPASKTGMSEKRMEADGTIVGVISYRIRFPITGPDPGVEDADERIDWTRAGSITKDPPARLRSLGPEELPGAGAVEWIVFAERKG
jgi:hypothetical protein